VCCVVLSAAKRHSSCAVGTQHEFVPSVRSVYRLLLADCHVVLHNSSSTQLRVRLLASCRPGVHCCRHVYLQYLLRFIFYPGQRGYVFIRVKLVRLLLFSKITLKLLHQFSHNSMKRQHAPVETLNLLYKKRHWR